jgi:hypothetical protein
MRRCFSVLFGCGLILSATAVTLAEPKLEMHRSGVNAIDKSGWQLAESSRGGFSIRMPIPFNDFSVRTSDPNVGDTIIHTVGGKSTEGIKLSVTEVPITPRSKVPADLSTIPEQIGQSPRTKISDVRRDSEGGVDSISFLASRPTTSAYMRTVKTSKAVYSLTIEFPNAQRETVDAVKDEFFGSFKLKN